MTQGEDTGRFELKFVASETSYGELENWLRQHSAAFCRSYSARRVNNVYFDRFDYECYSESIAGVSSRAKVRYRWYGESLLPEPGQLEVKVRQNRIGWKQVFPVRRLSRDLNRWSQVKLAICSSIPEEAKAWLHEHSHPVIINRYDREYWVSRDNGIRATLDRHQAVFDQRYSDTINFKRRTELPPVVVLEIKGSAQDHEALSRLVANLPLPLSRHSKYCAAVDAIQGF